MEDANDVDDAGFDAAIDEIARELGDWPPAKPGQRDEPWAKEASGGGIASNLFHGALDRRQETVCQCRCGLLLQIVMYLQQVGNGGFTELEPGADSPFRGCLTGARVRGAAKLGPEVLADRNGGRLQAFEQLLLNLFVLAVAADKVADKFAGGRVVAALDAGFDVAAEGFGSEMFMLDCGMILEWHIMAVYARDKIETAHSMG